MFKLIFLSFMLLSYVSLIKPIFLGFPLFYFFVPIGIFLFFNDIKKNRFNLKKDFFNLFFIFLLVFIVFVVSYLVNQVGDFYYIKEVIQFNLFAFFSCYFLVKFYLKNIDKKIDLFVLIFIFVVFLQLFLSFVALINPSFFNFIFSIIDSTILFDGSLDSYSEFRMVVIGTPFFGSAIINSFTLIVIASYFPFIKYKKFLVFMWFAISILGLLSARTTIVGIIISLLVYSLQFAKLRSNFLIYLILPSLFIFLIVQNVNLNNQFQSIKESSFDFLVNYKDSKASDSTDELIDMYSVLPDNIKTWIIGDNFFKNEQGLYYRDIDIGYSRIIFSNGLVGLFIFIILNFFLLKKSKIPYFPFLFLLILILNFKGFTNLIYLIFLFYVFQMLTRNQNIIKVTHENFN